MNTCNTCGWWEQFDIEAGQCRFPKMHKDTGGAGVRVYGGSEPITTEAKFGCVHHELPKPISPERVREVREKYENRWNEQ